MSASREVSPSALMPAGQGGRQGGGCGSSQGQPRGMSRKREPKGSSHAKPGAPTQKAYVATPADREGTRSITEYFVRRGPLSPRSDGSVFTASEGGTSSRAPSRQGDAPQTSSTSLRSVVARWAWHLSGMGTINGDDGAGTEETDLHSYAFDG